MKRRDVHTIIDGLKKWQEGWTNLNDIDWLLGAPLGTLATLFLENELADVEGRPLDGRTLQDAINVMTIYLAMRSRATLKGKPRALRPT